MLFGEYCYKFEVLFQEKTDLGIETRREIEQRGMEGEKEGKIKKGEGRK